MTKRTYTIVDDSGNEEIVENNGLIEEIEKTYHGRKATNVLVEKETKAISATIEGVGSYIGVGWLDSNGKLER